MSYQKYFTCVVKNGTLYIKHVPFSPNTCNMKSKINWKRYRLLKWEMYILILVYNAYGNWYLKCILFHIKGRTLELHWTAQYSIRLWIYAEKTADEFGFCDYWIKVYILLKKQHPSKGHQANLIAKETNIIGRCMRNSMYWYNVRAIPGKSCPRPVVVCVWLAYSVQLTLTGVNVSRQVTIGQDQG